MSSSYIPEPKDICWGKIPFNDSTDNRYGVVLDPPVNNLVKVFAISAQQDLFNPAWHIPIDKDDPDFEATNLKKSSYIVCEAIISVKVSDIKYTGKLEGNLAKTFESWI